MVTHQTTDWNIALITALLTSGLGVFLGEPALLLLSIPGVVFAGYSRITTIPTPTLAIERTISENDPSHNQNIEVTVTLRNSGDQSLSQVSIVDGVPPMLSVQEGSARHAASLGPGDDTTFSYTVLAKHGIHHFRPATAVLRDTSGSVAVETTVSADTEIACRSPIQTVSFGQTTHQRAGATLTTGGGNGTEFSKVRSYQLGDPPNRIDWNRYARDGELTTVSFREDRSQATVICLDAREICYRSSGSSEPHAVFYERAAARELLDAFSDVDESIGIIVFGSNHCWLAPDTGSHHVATVQRTLEDPTTLPLEPPSKRTADETVDEQVRMLQTRIGRSTRVILLSPVLDVFPVETARLLQADGHSVTVLSPNVTASKSTGTAVAQLHRINRLAALRRADITAVDWKPEESLEAVISTGVRQ